MEHDEVKIISNIRRNCYVNTSTKTHEILTLENSLLDILFT